MRRLFSMILAAIVPGCAVTTGDDVVGTEAQEIVPSLEATVKSLVANAPKRSPNTQVAIAVRNLTTNEYVESAGAGDRYVSASSAKAIWVAAAMKNGANVDDIATPIFRDSDNNAASVAVQRAGGCDAVNTFMWNVVDMDGVFLDHTPGTPALQAATNGALDGSNYFTARASVLFLTKIFEGKILTGTARDKLLEYMARAPDHGLGGWLAEYLPASVRPKVMHKGGWLPPGTSERGTLNDIGIVTTPNGTRYAVAILARRTADAATASPTGAQVDYWGKHASFVKHASCAIYRAIAKDSTLDCH